MNSVWVFAMSIPALKRTIKLRWIRSPYSNRLRERVARKRRRSWKQYMRFTKRNALRWAFDQVRCFLIGYSERRRTCPMNISVAMCTYNGSRYLAQQLNSIGQQTLAPYELVICDDGSSDSTEEIVAQFRDSVAFPVLFHRNVHNLGSTRNFDQAIRLCRGDSISLCDQDDVWHPAKLGSLASALDGKPELAGVFSDANLVDERGDVQPGSLWQSLGFTVLRQRNFNRQTAPDQLIQRDTVTGATLLFRASYVPMLVPIPTEWIHDGWVALLLASVAEIEPLALPLMAYRLHTQQQVGVRETPWRAHLSTKKQSALLFYSIQAIRFRLLLERLEEIASLKDAAYPIHPAVLEKVRRKIRFFETRASILDLSAVHRLCAATRLLPEYRLYEKGMFSLIRDLMH